jgi:hypothetical protein
MRAGYLVDHIVEFSIPLKHRHIQPNKEAHAGSPLNDDLLYCYHPAQHIQNKRRQRFLDFFLVGAQCGGCQPGCRSRPSLLKGKAIISRVGKIMADKVDDNTLA